MTLDLQKGMTLNLTKTQEGLSKIAIGVNWGKIKEITNYNKQHFFSDQFFNLIINELKYNLQYAFATLEDTNTSKTFIEYRKKYNGLLVKIDPGRYKIKQNQRKQMKHQLIPVLRKARSYYNQYVESLKQ